MLSRGPVVIAHPLPLVRQCQAQGLTMIYMKVRLDISRRLTTTQAHSRKLDVNLNDSIGTSCGADPIAPAANISTRKSRQKAKRKEWDQKIATGEHPRPLPDFVFSCPFCTGQYGRWGMICHL